MADFFSPSSNPPIMHFASSSGASADDSFEDVCSICLESFDNQDPPTVTNCKHEYHLQCILEWSQRSKECPICWQLLVLKDPSSQGLLAAVENERSLRSRLKVHHSYEDREIDHDAPYMDDSDFEERIMWNFAAAASRGNYVIRRGRQRSSGVGPSQVLPTSPVEFQNSGYESSGVESPTSSPPSTIIDKTPEYVVPSTVNMVSNSVGNRDGPVKTRVLCSHPPPESPRRPSSSEFLAFPESIKSKLSAASARYKESISKGTRGFKEKLQARNNSVKELSRGVHREMSAGIAGVARMIERLDLASKRTGVSAPLSNCDGGTSNLSYKGKGVHENVIPLSLHGNTGEIAHDMSSHAAPYVSNTVPGRVEVSLIQSGN